MEQITVKQLEELGGLYFPNVIVGTNRYPYEGKKGTEEEVLGWFQRLSRKHTVYADFYGGRIKEENLKEFEKHLSQDEFAELLKLWRAYASYEGEDFIIFEPEERELELLVKISYRELLFSTFYITDPAITIWSNYEGEFVFFATNPEILKEIVG